ncbi:MAG: hypothetical protein OER95_05610 [Acidimicrobiia bacterium]|nr:hypothetical protein [Acidimicrobiia bacterium]
MVSPRFDAILVTTRGLVVRDPGSREFFGVPWANFSPEDHLRFHSRHAVLTLWLYDNRPVDLAIDRRLADNIAAIAPVLKMNPEVTVDQVLVLEANVGLQAEPLPTSAQAVGGSGTAPSGRHFRPLAGPIPPAAELPVERAYYDDPVIIDEPVSLDGPAMGDGPPVLDERLLSDDAVVVQRDSTFKPSAMPTAPVSVLRLPPVTQQRRKPTPADPDSESMSDAAPPDDMARRAAWVGAAVLLLLVAALVGTVTSRYTGAAETGTARLLTSESVDLD